MNSITSAANHESSVTGRDDLPLPPGSARQKALGDAHEALTQALTEVEPDQETVRSKVEGLLGSVNRTMLDLRGFDAAWLCSYGRMPPKAWTALDRYVKAGGETGITAVSLDPMIAFGGALIEGLKQLPALERLKVDTSSGLRHVIDLGDLQKSCPRLDRMDIVGNVFKPLKIIVPSGMKVAATGPSQPVLQKSLVYYRNSANETESLPRPLHGQIHDRTARDFGVGHAPSMEKQELARGVNQNCEVTMDLTDPHSGLSKPSEIVCRHLAMSWLQKRFDHLTAKLHAASTSGTASSSSSSSNSAVALAPVPDYFSYESFRDEPGIRSLIHAGAEEDAQTLRDADASDLFEADQFGATLADEFAKLATGGFRHFAVSTTKHMLGLELRVKERWHGDQLRREFVVNLYDPNSTATHERLVVSDLSQLRTMKLADWVAEDSMSKYFHRDGPAVAGLHPWPRATAQPGDVWGPSTHVSQANRATGAFLRAALTNAGSVAHVRQAVGSLVSEAHQVGRSGLEAELSVTCEGLPALYSAGEANRADVVGAFVDETLGIPDSILSAEAKLRVLKAEIIRDFTFLERMVCQGRTGSTRGFVRAVLGVPADALGLEDRLELLGLRKRPGPMLTGLTAFVPVSPLHAQAQHDAVRAYVQEILNSALSAQDKNMLFADLWGARRDLMSVNPGAVAAMALGILASNVADPTKTKLLAQLGMGIDEILAALREKGDPEGQAPEIDRLLAAMQP